ncbi:hypothetical protein GYMLUDRAFT_135045, partial [Collybiopsis luxurians FD-317 M1]
LLLWLKGNISPQEMRDCILDPESGWSTKVIQYLESIHCGEYNNGSQNDINQMIKSASLHPNYQNLTETMPIPPPPLCGKHQSLQALPEECESCKTYRTWRQNYEFTVDNLISKSNFHTCDYNKWGKCKAHFLWPLFKETVVDLNSGAIFMCKGEPWLNMFTHVLTYILRCNTDITNLSFGTAIKATVLYISDYITKASLKTHVVFSCISSVFTK